MEDLLKNLEFTNLTKGKTIPAEGNGDGGISSRIIDHQPRIKITNFPGHICLVWIVQTSPSSSFGKKKTREIVANKRTKIICIRGEVEQ